MVTERAEEPAGASRGAGFPSPTSLGSRSTPHAHRAGCLRSGDTGGVPKQRQRPWVPSQKAP